MKRKKRITIIAIILVILGIIIGNGVYQYNHNKDFYNQSTVKKIVDVFDRNETIDEAAINFTVYDTASITKLFFADKSGNQTLLERGNNGWIINNEYPANQDLVNQMLYTINRIHIKPMSIKKKDNIVTQMAATNTKVEVYQIMPRINLFNKIKLFYHETRSRVYYVGGVTQDNTGTYVLSEGGDNVYIAYLPALNGSISSRFSALPLDWRSHIIFNNNINDIASVKLEINNEPDNSFIINTIDRAQYSMTRLNGQPVDFSENRVLTLMSSFQDVRFEAFLNDIEPARRDSIINSPFKERLTLTTKDGKVRSITTFRLIAQSDIYDYSQDDIDNFEDILTDVDHKYALLSEGNEFVLIQDFVLGKLLEPAYYYDKNYREDVPQIYYKELETVESR